MKKILLILPLLFFSKACSQSKDKNVNNNKIDTMNSNTDKKIKDVLISQLKDGESSLMGEEFESHKYNEKDLESIIPIIKIELENNNYKFLNVSEFNSRIFKIFNRKLDPNSSKSFLYVNFEEKCEREPIYTLLKIYPGTFIIKNEGFLTDLYAIPQLIDYQNKFPELIDVENEKILKKEPDLGKEIEIPHWKDISDLKTIRKKNIQTVVARNMYLFNDNKAQYKWLILNDQYFMESLVKTFGYTEDSDLLKWIIERTKFDKNNPQDYGKLFWIKQCDGTLKLHANTFKVLQTLYQPNDNSENRFILDNIQAYLEYLGNLEDIKTENISEADKVKIMANLTYFAEQYKYNKNFNSNSKMMGRLRFFLNDEDIEILKKNNYFNLPKFKEWWDNADYDEYIVDYNQVWGRDNEPMDYNEWRNQHPKK